MGRFSDTQAPREIVGSANAELLSRGCFCVTLDRTALAAAFDKEAGVEGLAPVVIAS